MVNSTKIFVVLNPKIMEQAALTWGEKIALDLKKHRSDHARLHVYCCIDDEATSLRREEDLDEAATAAQRRVRQWIGRLVMHTRSLGIDLTIEVERNENWRSAMVAAVARNGSDVVIKNMTQHARLVRLLRDTADWRLLRDCRCPVMLVKTPQPYDIHKVLVAVKPSPDDVYEAANANILEAARSIAEDLGADLHAVTCYKSDALPDWQRFADSCGLERQQVTADIGVPEKVIAATASEIDADLVVIARVARSESKSLLGDTARKVIDEVDTEVLVLPMSA